MNVPAFLLSILAIVIFAVAHYGGGRPDMSPRLSVALGLVVLTAAWVLQLVLGGDAVHIN